MSAPSSSTVIALKLVEKYLYQVGCPILITLGVLGTITNLLVFTHKKLRKNPCSIYFVAHNLASFLYIWASLFALTVSLGYKADVASNYPVICRIRLYATLLFNVLSSFYLILASIDRILITSRSATIRQKSTVRRAFICILAGTVFWALFHTHALVLFTITMVAPNVYICYFPFGPYLVFMSYYSLIKELGTLLLLTVFGWWSIRRVQKAHRVIPAPNRSATGSLAKQSLRSSISRDRQLVLMLAMDITMYAVCSIAIAATLMYQQITQNQAKSADQTNIESVIRNISLFLAGIPFCLTCYTNLLVSKTFRGEVKKVFSCQNPFGMHWLRTKTRE